MLGTGVLLYRLLLLGGVSMFQIALKLYIHTYFVYFFFHFMFMGALPVYMSVYWYVWWPHRPEAGLGSLRTRVITVSYHVGDRN